MDKNSKPLRRLAGHALACAAMACWGHAALGAEPAWAERLPSLVLAGGVSGRACLGTPMEKREVLIPSHCRHDGLAGDGHSVGSAARDYAFVAAPAGHADGPKLGSGMLARRRHAMGERVWIQRSSRWSPARIEAVTGAGYWLRSEGEPFCPGDSGAAAWAAEDGSPVWIAMVVSGGSPAGCSERAAAVGSQAIDWPWAR